MQLNNLPLKIQEAFGVNGQRNAIPVASQVNVTPGAASFNDGFPPATMQPISSGGVPPSGKDVNGILYAITAVQQWQCAGGQFQFDATFAAANGGYPKGAILLSADGYSLWQNIVDGNTTNPDATDGSAANWTPQSVTGFGSVPNLTNANVTLTPAQWGKFTIAFSGALTGNVQAIMPTIAGLSWNVVNNTTGNYTLTVKTAAGTGVIVAQGYALRVLCDGTNIKAAGFYNGQPIDATPIGQATPAAGAFTVINATSASTINVTGALTWDLQSSNASGAYARLFDKANNLTRGWIGWGAAVIAGAAIADLCIAPGTGGAIRFGNPNGSATNAALLSNGNFQVGSGTDTGDKWQNFGSSMLGGTVKFAGGAWSAPAAGNGIGYTTTVSGLIIGGNGSSYDVTLTNKSGNGIIQIPTGTQRVLFNGATDTGDYGVFGGPVAVGSATSAAHAARYDQTFGLGQSWQDLTASRAFGTTYTNTANKAISVFVNGGGTTTSASMTATVGSVQTGFATLAAGTNTFSGGLLFVVPPGATYSVSGTNASLTHWSELR